VIDPSEIAAARQALGRLLAKYRKAAGLNQHQLAPHTHYGRSTIANVEVGRQNVPRDFWERCEQALSAGGRLLAASERLDQLLRQQREETAPLAAVEQRAAAPASGQRYLPGVIGRLSKAMPSPASPATTARHPSSTTCTPG